MAITTYDELKTSVADFLNRDDLTSVIPDFITMAEADLNRNVRHWRMEGRANANIDSKFSAIPGDFLEVITFHTTTGNFRPIELLSQGELLQRREATQDTSGAPSFTQFQPVKLRFTLPQMVFTAPSFTITSALVRLVLVTQQTGY